MPYYGFVDIDSELFIDNKYLCIDLAVDYNDGTGKYLLYMRNEFPSNDPYKQYFKTIDVQLAVSIPIGGTNAAELINTAIFKSIQLAAGVASG